MKGLELFLDGLNRKTFNEMEYPCTIEVKVTIGDDTFTDQIKGLNAGHALHNAYDNWPTATNIQLIKEVK